MFKLLYDWILNIAFYMVLATALIQAVPGQDYKKYIRFFTGLVLILLLASPILGLFGMEDKITDLYDSKSYQEAVKRIEGTTSYLNDIDVSQYFPESVPDEETAGENNVEIEVEEIHIGK